MPMWPQPTGTAVQRAREAHLKLVGTPVAKAASAPATWSVIGEHLDHFGGMAVMGIAAPRIAAAVSPRTDDTIAVTLLQTQADGEPEVVRDSISFADVAELSAAQQPGIDKEGRPIARPLPPGGLAARVGGLITTMVARQLLSRDTSGTDVTVVSDIPAHAGLGEDSALDIAVALAMTPEDNSELDAPMRARIAEVCAQAMDVFSATPPSVSRHTTALRGSGAEVSIIDYADGSVTHAPHPINHDLAGYLVAAPTGPRSSTSPTAADNKAATQLRARQKFVLDACHAFGVDVLRLLPDAPQRVIEWLDAVHEIHGPHNQPTLEQAKAWMDFYDAETARGLACAKALRSRRSTELFPQLATSQSDLRTGYGLDTADSLAELLRVRGAVAARAASAGNADAVIAYVTSEHAHNFAADLAADGLIVVELAPGEPANCDEPSLA